MCGWWSLLYVGVKVPPETLDYLKELAKQQSKTISEIIRERINPPKNFEEIK